MINRTATEKRDQGFTLIELLVVIIITGILAAIAIPVFLNERQKGVDASLKSDLRNAASAIETFSTADPTAGSLTMDDAYENGFVLTAGNVLTVTGSPLYGYCLYGYNPDGSNYVDAASALSYDSLMGGLGQSGGACTGNPDLATGGSSAPAMVQIVVGTISPAAKSNNHNADYFVHVEVSGGSYSDANGEWTQEGIDKYNEVWAGVKSNAGIADSVTYIEETDLVSEGPGRMFITSTKSAGQLQAEFSAALGLA